jgi:hypothetical protein
VPRRIVNSALKEEKVQLPLKHKTTAKLRFFSVPCAWECEVRNRWASERQNKAESLQQSFLCEELEIWRAQVCGRNSGNSSRAGGMAPGGGFSVLQLLASAVSQVCFFMTPAVEVPGT